jgi:hypothetical protein
MGELKYQAKLQGIMKLIPPALQKKYYKPLQKVFGQLRKEKATPGFVKNFCLNNYVLWAPNVDEQREYSLRLRFSTPLRETACKQKSTNHYS